MERKDHGGQRDITGTLSTGRKDDLLVANLTRCRAEPRPLRAKTYAPAPPLVFCAPWATINDTNVFDFKSRSLSIDAPEHALQASRRATFSKSEISGPEDKMKIKASKTRFLSTVWRGRWLSVSAAASRWLAVNPMKIGTTNAARRRISSGSGCGRLPSGT